MSINHIVSMTIPAAAGAIWAGLGFEKVFLAAAFLALTNAVVASFVPGQQETVRSPEPAPDPSLAEYSSSTVALRTSHWFALSECNLLTFSCITSEEVISFSHE